MDNLAGVLNSQSKYDQAKEIHRQELKLWEKVLRQGHPAILTSMDNLAIVPSEQVN